MAGAKGIIGARPGSHRVRSYTKATKSGMITVREHTASNAQQVSHKLLPISSEMKSRLAKRASARSAKIREVRLRALAKRY